MERAAQASIARFRKVAARGCCSKSQRTVLVRLFAALVAMSLVLLYFSQKSAASVSNVAASERIVVGATSPATVTSADVDSLPPSLPRDIPPSAGGFPNGAANRAPSREAIVVANDVTPRLTEITEQSAICYDRSGAVTATPKWVIPLMKRLQPQYSTVRDITSSDEWRVMIGWVPSRFMAPQKPGKKANGDVMVPPTKGRNHSFYLREYNASWHTSFDESGYEYHFQVVHRNALAVCIRERLHVLQYFCSPSDSIEPLIVYQCPCRHCREGFVKKSTTSGNHQKLSLSRASNYLLHNLGKPEMKISTAAAAVLPPHEAPSGCVEDFAAPWLMSRALIPKFPYEGASRNLDVLLQIQADVNKIVLVTIFNKFWVDHLHNFVYSMVTRARLVNFIVATMDQEALQLCLDQRLPCFDATEYAEFEPDMVVGGAGYKQGNVRKVSEAMSWIKPRLAVAVLSRGYGFFMCDLDMTWNKNPLKEILDVRVDVAHQCDTNNKFSINSGFYFARANPRTIAFFNNLMVFAPEENSDQTAMKLFAKYDHTHGASNTCLHKWSFNMKCNYKVDGSVKVVGGVETFEWRPYDGGHVMWTIMHATCLSGAKAKLRYLRTIGAWRLDELDNITESSKDYCVVTRAHELLRENASSSEVFSASASKRSIGRGTTIHSTSYDKSVDNTFLAKRH